eukprot:1161491-Pelagomonas_calceolata.AAC.10
MAVSVVGTLADLGAMVGVGGDVTAVVVALCAGTAREGRGFEGWGGVRERLRLLALHVRRAAACRHERQQMLLRRLHSARGSVNVRDPIGAFSYADVRDDRCFGSRCCCGGCTLQRGNVNVRDPIGGFSYADMRDDRCVATPQKLHRQDGCWGCLRGEDKCLGLLEKGSKPGGECKLPRTHVGMPWHEHAGRKGLLKKRDCLYKCQGRRIATNVILIPLKT